MSQTVRTVVSYHLTILMLFSYTVINRAYNRDSRLIVRARICSEKCTELNMTQIEIFKILKKQMHGVGEYYCVSKLSVADLETYSVEQIELLLHVKTLRIVRNICALAL